MQTEDGELTGFLIELYDEICRELELRCKVEELDDFNIDIEDTAGGFWSALYERTAASRGGSRSSNIVLGPIVLSDDYHESEVQFAAPFAKVRNFKGEICFTFAFYSI